MRKRISLTEKVREVQKRVKYGMHVMNSRAGVMESKVREPLRLREPDSERDTINIERIRDRKSE